VVYKYNSNLFTFIYKFKLRMTAPNQHILNSRLEHKYKVWTVLVFIHVQCAYFFKTKKCYFMYHIQDVAHNFDNIFISLGFPHKLTVFYDKNNPAECNEQHGFLFFSRIIIVGISRSIIQTSRSLGLPLLCPLSKLCKNFFLCLMAVRIQNKIASIFI